MSYRKHGYPSASLHTGLLSSAVLDTRTVRPMPSPCFKRLAEIYAKTSTPHVRVRLPHWETWEDVITSTTRVSIVYKMFTFLVLPKPKEER